MAYYNLFVPLQAVAANVVYFDLFNASGSGAIVEVKSVIPVVSGATAVTGVLGVDIFLTKTTAVGTGGTAATQEGTGLTTCTFSGHDNQQPLPALITARLTPTGGATAGGVLSWCSLSAEETASTTYGNAPDMVCFDYDDCGFITLSANKGIRVVQGATAALVGNIGFNVMFNVSTK